MNRWSVDVTGANGERDQIEVSDVGDLARTVGAAVVSGAVRVEINAGGASAVPILPPIQELIDAAEAIPTSTEMDIQWIYRLHRAARAVKEAHRT